MGNEIFIQNKRVCVKPLRSRLEVIQKLQTPHYGKSIQKLCGNGEFLEHVLSQITKAIKTNI